jgi:hypothetical protein
MDSNKNIKEFTGNLQLLDLHKTAFLCSRKVPAGIVLKCYDWAIQQRDSENCVISGFHSQIEKDVLHFLLKGSQPIIVVMARSLKKKMEPEFVKPVEEGRLLIISPFSPEVLRASEKTASVRNLMMNELADQITIGFASPGGQLEKLINQTSKQLLFLSD